jgi:hypothetical protein
MGELEEKSRVITDERGVYVSHYGRVWSKILGIVEEELDKKLVKASEIQDMLFEIGYQIEAAVRDERIKHGSITKV